MKATTPLLFVLLSTQFLWGQDPTAIVPIYPPEVTAQGKTAEMASPKVFPLVGDDLIPQIANGELGGGQIFYMLFLIENITGAEAQVDIDYLDADGDPMSLPSRNAEGQIQNFTGILSLVPARGIRYLTTWPFDAPVRVGYARVASTPPGAVTVTALYNNSIPGVPLFQTAIPMTTRNHNRFFVPYGNLSGQRSAVAVVSLTAQTITVNARDPNGIIECSFDRAMTAGSHYPFLVQSELPCTVDNEGVIEVAAPSPTLGGVAFTAQPAGEIPGAGAFTTLQAFGPTP